MSGRMLLAICLVALAATPAVAEDEVLHDHWFATFQGGRKTGWEHVTRVRSVREGVAHIVTETESRTLRGPGGELLETPIRGTTRFVETEDGVVVQYVTSVDIGFGPQTRAGKTEGGTIQCVEDGKERELAYPEGALGPAAIDRAIAATLEPGGSGSVVEFRAIDPASSGKLTWKVPDTTQMIDVLGVHAWLFVVEKSDGALPESLYYDGAGRLWGGENLWHPVDPMRIDRTREVRTMRDLRGHGGVGPTHVAVLRSDAATHTPFTDVAVPVLEWMDGLRIEIVEPAE